MHQGRLVLIVVGLLVVLTGLAAGCTQPASPAATTPASEKVAAPTLVIAPSPILKLDAKTQVTILGSGFAPKQAIRLEITHIDGTRSEITDALEPAPLTNADGAFATRWTVGDYSNSKLAGPQVFQMTATDSEFKVLATTPFGYYDAKKPYEQWPTWAQAVIAKPK